MARTSRILLTAFVIAAMAIGALVYLSVRDRDSTTTAQPDTGEAGRWCARTATDSTRCPTAR